MRRFVRFFGSIGFAFFLIAGLAAVLVVSTLLESKQGTPFAQRFFYQAGWFDVFLGLFGLNILCSSLSRWPYKKHHTGFLVVHTGILMILAGSFLARYQGMDGQMALYENESSDRVLLAGYELVAHLPDHGVQTLATDKPASLAGRTLFEADGERVYVRKALSGVPVNESVEEGGTADPDNPGLQFTLKSQMAGAVQPLSLFLHHPYNDSPNSASMGPATFELKSAPPRDADDAPTGPRLRVILKESGQSFDWGLTPLPQGDLPLGSTGLVLKNLRYLPDARVDGGNSLVNVSEEPNNPAVEFTVEDGSGRREFHTRFELFPDFESLHGREKNDMFHLEVELATPAGVKAAAPHGTGIQFFRKDGKWAYKTHSAKNAPVEGVLETGHEYPAGWMDFTFTVDRLFSKAVIKKIVGGDGPGPRTEMAAEIVVEKNGREVFSDWVLANDAVRVQTSKGPFIAALRQRSATVPFKLTLKDFRKVDYPGTEQAQSFESDVALEDPSEGLKIEKTIRMNKPLDHKGYRIFQSSYSQDPAQGETSVFTVAKNPGIGLIYGGSIVMCLGIVIVFYVKPLSSFGKRGILP